MTSLDLEQLLRFVGQRSPAGADLKTQDRRSTIKSRKSTKTKERSFGAHTCIINRMGLRLRISRPSLN
jgi:hypothetical protein